MAANNSNGEGALTGPLSADGSVLRSQAQQLSQNSGGNGESLTSGTLSGNAGAATGNPQQITKGPSQTLDHGQQPSAAPSTAPSVGNRDTPAESPGRSFRSPAGSDRVQGRPRDPSADQADQRFLARQQEQQDLLNQVLDTVQRLQAQINAGNDAYRQRGLERGGLTPRREYIRDRYDQGPGNPADGLRGPYALGALNNERRNGIIGPKMDSLASRNLPIRNAS